MKTRPTSAVPRDILLSQRFLPELGGSIQWMYEIYRRWPRPVDVVTHDYGVEPPAEPNFHIERRDLFLDNCGLLDPSRLWRYGRMTRAIARRLPAGPVTVHCRNSVPEAVSLLPIRYLWGSRLKIVCYAHGEETGTCLASRELAFLMRRAHAATDIMIANSRFTADILADHIDPSKVRIIHPGVDVASFDGAEQRGQAWLRQHDLLDRQVVLTVGRLTPRKNQSAVIDAVAGLVPEFPRLVYVLIGDGPDRSSLEAQTRRLGIANKVIFCGAVDEPTKQAALGACSVFVMVSVLDGTEMEGFGMVFLEAAACRKPSIAGTLGGQPEAVLDGETGLVVDGESTPDVARALRRLLIDEELRQRMGHRARKRVHAFDWSEVLRRTLDVVNPINGGSPRVRLV